MTSEFRGVRYVRAVARALAERAGGALVLSPRDFERISGWHARGIPLGLVLEALDEKTATGRRASPPRGGGLAAVARAVEESWEAVRDGRVRPRPPGEEEPLPTLASALGAWRRAGAAAAEGSPLRSLLHGLLVRSGSGDLPQELDAALDAAIAAAAPPALLARVEADAGRELEPFRRRMEPAVFEATRRRSAVDRLRRALDLPRLALTRDPRSSRHQE